MQGVALNVEQMVVAFLESELLFLSDGGVFELEGEIGTIKLPTTLQEST